MAQVKFLGDVSFNNKYQNYKEAGLDPFKNISSYLDGNCYTVANLECLPMGHDGTNPLRSVTLSCTKDVLGYLKIIDVDLVTLANNHVYDNLESGFTIATDFLNSNDISYIGATQENTSSFNAIIKIINTISVAFLSYVDLDTNPNIPTGSKIKTSILNRNEVISDIENYKDKVDHIVLLLHWGGRVEHFHYPEINQISMARDFVDAGASLIIGHHSHTFQPFDVYKGKYIFYSIGNFCFTDIILNDGHVQRVPNKQSAVVNVEFYKEHYNVEINPFQCKSGILTPISRFSIMYGFRCALFSAMKKYTSIFDLMYFRFKFIDSFIAFVFSPGRPLRYKGKKLINAVIKRYSKYYNQL